MTKLLRIGFGAVLASRLIGCSTESDRGSDSPDVAENAELSDGECRSDDDCSGDGRCRTASLDGPARRLQMVFDPCSIVVPCNSDLNCGTDLVCQQPNRIGAGVAGPLQCGVAECAVPCGPEGRTCATNETCSTDGHCVPVSCDDPEYSGCPDDMECDPTYDINDGTRPVGGYHLSGTGMGVSYEHQLAASTGCVFRRCDDPAAIACFSGYRCEPETDSTTTGCVGIPCQELGQCFSDFYICEPVSSQPRPSGEDDHGCVPKNCEERDGDCGERQICDASRPDARADGCDYVRCDEPGGSCPLVNTKCDPDAERADVYGCGPVQCDVDEYMCDDGWLCLPSHEFANQFGCVREESVLANQGGNGGTQSSGGSGNSPSEGAGGRPNGTGSADNAGEAGMDNSPNPSTPAGGTSPNDADAAGAPNDDTSGAGSNGDEPPAPLPDVRPDGAGTGSSCRNDIDCRTGYCVLGRCSDRAGTCQ